jgi:hypothetical protein
MAANTTEIFIKLATRDYHRLRSHIPVASRAQDAISKATPIDHAVEGVQFAGFTIPCNEEQARIILEIARQHCPSIIPEIEDAIRLARPGSSNPQSAKS